MKVFTFYLPQFHIIPENNEWWGDGFTEWTNVKKATPLFRGHKQPLHPLNDNYYDLTNKKTVLWQTELFAKYKIDGFIYYHYYFKGKKLLEKPAENLLKDKTIKQPFFFCWANHSWNRSWEGTQTVLLEQTYGEIEEWEKHFQYLLPFFKDERYEKKENKPLLMLFMPFFDEKEKMMHFFDKRCKDEGFDGIAVIDTILNTTTSQYKDYCASSHINTRYVFYREPGVGQALYKKKNRVYIVLQKTQLYFRKHFHIGHKVIKYSGNKILKESMRFSTTFNNSLKGLFFEWDNTPRHGYRGYIIKPISKKNFIKWMNIYQKQDYNFLNAWNEWCEGMMLEPTVEYGYKYLEWIKEYREKNHI